MNKLYKLLFLFIASALIVSCNHNEDGELGYTPNANIGWVQFDSNNLLEVYQEEEGSISLPVSLQAPENNSDLKVEFELVPVSGANPNDYFTNKKLVIPAGYSNFIGPENGTGKVNSPVLLTYDLNYAKLTDKQLEPMIFDVVIKNTNNKNISVGLDSESKFPTVKRVKICGRTAFSESYTATASAFGDEISTFDLNPQLVEGTTNQYFVAAAWGPNFIADATGNSLFAGLFTYPAILTINDDFSVTVEGRGFYATGGTGTFDVCTNTITYELSQELFTTPFTVTVVATVPAP